LHRGDAEAWRRLKKIVEVGERNRGKVSDIRLKPNVTYFASVRWFAG
jgi:hypothetical protein